MEIFSVYKNLVKESLLLKSFKGMNKVLAVLSFIVLLPFIALYAVMLLGYLLDVTLYRIVEAALDYFYGFVRSAGNAPNVHPLTQAVIYLIVFPAVAFIKFWHYLFILSLHFMHFAASIVGYIATFGGIKFKPFLLEDANRFENKNPVEHCKKAVVCFVVIALLFASLGAFFKPIAENIYASHTGKEVGYYLVAEITTVVAEVFIVCYLWFTIIYTCVYNNVGKRKKYIEHLSPLPEEASV